MEITYDSKIDALNIVLRKGRVFKTVEISPGVLLDLDKLGRPLYMEIIDAKEKIGRRQLTEFTMRNLVPVA